MYTAVKFNYWRPVFIKGKQLILELRVVASRQSLLLTLLQTDD
jgi:hypothetical protein